MNIEGTGRFVFWAQWPLALFLPFFVVIGRGFIGAQLGWMTLIGAFYGVFVIGLLLIPPILTLFDRDVRAARATRLVYDIATALMWLGLLLAGLSIPDGGDSGPLPSALSAWTGMSDDASAVIFYVAAALVMLAYVGAFAAAITGIVHARRGRVDADASAQH